MRGVFYERAAEKAVEDAAAKWSRTDDVVETIEWVLARDPEFGASVTESGRVRAFVYDGAASVHMPTARVLYTIEPHDIVIQEIAFHQPKAMRHGNA